MNEKKVKKAIIAAAGFGTRFLPTTKVMQKEMIPIVNAPIIHYSVQEVIESGVEEIIIVKREGRSQINEYFSKNETLEAFLKENKKMHYLEPFLALYKRAKITVIDQDESLPYGNGSPLLSAKEYVTPGESFFYLYSDDIVNSNPPCCQQLLNMYQKHQCSGILGVQRVPQEQSKLYGMIKLKDNTDLPVVEKIIEKPHPDQTPSCLASFGRYLVPYTIFEHLHPDKTGKDGELWMADAVHRLLETEIFLSCEIDGEWLTTGDPLNLFRANLTMLLEDKEYKDKVKDIMKEFL